MYELTSSYKRQHISVYLLSNVNALFLPAESIDPRDSEKNVGRKMSIITFPNSVKLVRRKRVFGMYLHSSFQIDFMNAYGNPPSKSYKSSSTPLIFDKVRMREKCWTTRAASLLRKTQPHSKSSSMSLPEARLHDRMS